MPSALAKALGIYQQRFAVPRVIPPRLYSLSPTSLQLLVLAQQILCRFYRHTLVVLPDQSITLPHPTTANTLYKMGNKAAARLRAMIAQEGKVVVCPGVQDGISARVAIENGVDAMFMTGAGVAMSVLGMPDLGLTTADDMVRTAGMIANLDRNVPVIADIDTGFGGPMMVSRTVQRYIQAGVAGFHIEDQVTTKRCGHLMGKELVDLDTYVARIRACDAARRELEDDIVIIARTDALQSYGFDEAIRRLKAAVAAGADVAFLEGMTTREQMEEFPKAMAGTPCFLNMVNGGVTPLVDTDEARKLGYKIVIWPCFAFRAAYIAYQRDIKELVSTGRLTEQYKADGKTIDGGVREVFELCGLSKCAAFDQEMGGKAFANGV
ncbi:Phosphoenolpyruvate/pyruvate domain-containing protein [Thozetella sp. PMI_491]|nr:Phosphoenolpyruvate/pyruvate domain-containing protein [Thozetella sp. PMI_491]